jgi:hypothetical protein
METPKVPSLPEAKVDRWMLKAKPSIDEVVSMLDRVRRLKAEARLAEAHLIGYARELLALDDMADDPEILRGGSPRMMA